MRTREIQHPILGNYEQYIFDTPSEAGHIDLASAGKYGWEIPPDIPTLRLLNEMAGKSILDLGCGWGNGIVIPAMKEDAKEVFALDITPEHLSDDSPMALKAEELGYSALHRVLISEDWWRQPLSPGPSLQSLFQPKQGNPPISGKIDIMTARHVLHFGNPEAILNVFDAVSLLLSPGGRFVSINFTEYVAFVYDYDKGATLNKIVAENKRYRSSESDLPGGYLSANNKLGLTLSELMGKPVFQGRDFLCFDDDTTHGLFNAWKNSRQARDLPVDLELTNSYLFTPTKIAKHNSLTEPGFESKENHYFELAKL